MAKGKIPKRPTRDEFVLEELGNQISEAFHEKSEVLLSIWAWEEATSRPDCTFGFKDR